MAQVTAEEEETEFWRWLQLQKCRVGQDETKQQNLACVVFRQETEMILTKQGH